jgi:Family of unknown function (DUF5678)
MSSHTLKEVSVPYTVNIEDEAVGRDTIVIRRNGEPVAVVIPFAEYQAMTAQPLPGDLGFEQERTAFQRLLPELLETHRGEWVAIVDGQPVEFGPDFSSVIAPVRQRFGQRPVYVREISEQARIYKISSPRLTRR